MCEALTVKDKYFYSSWTWALCCQRAGLQQMFCELLGKGFIAEAKEAPCTFDQSNEIWEQMPLLAVLWE